MCAPRTHSTAPATSELGVGCAEAEGRVQGTRVGREACKPQTCSLHTSSIQSDLAAGFSTLCLEEKEGAHEMEKTGPFTPQEAGEAENTG